MGDDTGDLAAPDADLGGEPDAMTPLVEPDAAPPLAVTALGPDPLLLAEGHTLALTVTLDRAAGAGGAAVELASDAGASLLLPASLVVPEGMTTASFDVQGAAVGGPFVITATLGASSATTSARVLPAIAQVSPGFADVTVGAGGMYTVTLAAAPAVPVTVTLASAAPALASLPASVVVPAGQTQAQFAVMGGALGGRVKLSATHGGQTVSADVRVVGVFLSEILYDVTGNDTNLEWIELYNASAVAVDLGAAGVKVQSANTGGAAPYKDTLVLTGTLMPGQCAVVGGPMGAVGFSYFQAADLSPDLGNVGTNGAADGIQLVTASGPIDNVLYGADNGDALTDENGLVPAAPDVGDADVNQTIERTAPGLAGPWQIQPTPSPGDCTPIGS